MKDKPKAGGTPALPGKCKETARRLKAIYPTPEIDLMSFIAVVASGERVCVYCGCSDAMGCPEGCWWVELHPCTPTGVCSVCANRRGAETQRAEKKPKRAGTSRGPVKYPAHRPNTEAIE